MASRSGGAGGRRASPLAHALLGAQGYAQSDTQMVLVVACRLDELDPHAAAILGMDEVDPGIRGAAPGGVVDQPDALLTQPLAQCVEITDAVSKLLQAGTALIEELRDR